MSHLHPIVTATDLSAPSRHAASRAAMLAESVGHPVEQVTRHADDLDAGLLVQEEQEQDCDLVVIGRQGRHALDELLLGSTTRMVISEGAADMLISSRRAG